MAFDRKVDKQNNYYIPKYFIIYASQTKRFAEFFTAQKKKNVDTALPSNNHREY